MIKLVTYERIQKKVVWKTLRKWVTKLLSDCVTGPVCCPLISAHCRAHPERREWTNSNFGFFQGKSIQLHLQSKRSLKQEAIEVLRRARTGCRIDRGTGNIDRRWRSALRCIGFWWEVWTQWCWEHSKLNLIGLEIDQGLQVSCFYLVWLSVRIQPDWETEMSDPKQVFIYIQQVKSMQVSISTVKKFWVLMTEQPGVYVTK